MKTDQKALDRQKKYEDSKRAKGFVRCILWVKKEGKEELKRCADSINSRTN